MLHTLGEHEGGQVRSFLDGEMSKALYQIFMDLKYVPCCIQYICVCMYDKVVDTGFPIVQLKYQSDVYPGHYTR